MLEELETVAARLKPPGPPRELYIFASGMVARDAGFRGPKLTHPMLPNARAVTTNMDPRDLRSMGPFGRVYVTDGARRAAYGERARERHLAELLHEARVMLRDAPGVWIEL